MKDKILGLFSGADNEVKKLVNSALEDKIFEDQRVLDHSYNILKRNSRDGVYLCLFLLYGIISSDWLKYEDKEFISYRTVLELDRACRFWNISNDTFTKCAYHAIGKGFY